MAETLTTNSVLFNDLLPSEKIIKTPPVKQTESNLFQNLIPQDIQTQKEKSTQFDFLIPKTNTFGITDKPPYWENKKIPSNLEVDYNIKRVPTIDGNKSWYDNFSYGFKMGILDTARGVTQFSGGKQTWFMDKTLEEQQQELHSRMKSEDGVWTTIGYFGGALLDPVTWLIPFTKAKTIYQMAKYGAISGGIVGALGYVDEESLLNTRSKQAAGGAVGGAIISPLIGKISQVLGARKLPSGFKPEDETLKVKSLNDSSFKTAQVQGAMGQRLRALRIRDDKDISFTEKELIKDLPKGYILNGPRLFFKNFIQKPYEEKGLVGLISRPFIGEEGVEKIPEALGRIGGAKGMEYLVSGKYGPDIATGIAGAFLSSNYVDEDAPMTQKLGAPLIGFLAGFGGVKGLKLIPRETTLLKGTPGQYTKTETFADWAARGLVDNYALPKEITKYMTLAQGKANSVGNTFAEIGERALQLTTDERKLLLNILEGDIKYSIPKPIKEISDDFRKQAKAIGQILVDHGVLSENTFKRNLDRYLKRSYEKYPQLAAVGDELKPRGITITVMKSEYLKRFKNDRAYYIGLGSDNEAIKEIQKIRFETPEKINSPEYKILESKINKENIIKNHAGWELFDITEKQFKKLNSNDSVTIRWELTKQERLAIGEIEDGALAIFETGRIFNGRLARTYFYDMISKDKNFAFTKPTAEQIREFNLKQVPNTVIENTGGKKRFGPLSGKYLPEEIYENIARVEYNYSKTPNSFYNKYKTLNGLWKVSKTAFNPTVHVNNTFTNVILYDLVDGKNLTTNLIAAYKGLTAAAKNQKSELFKLANEHGVFEADFVTNELKNISQVLKNNPYTVFGNKANDEFNNSVSAASIIWNDLKRSKFGLSNGYKFATDLYRFEDSVFRLALFRDRLAKGLSPVDAAMDARKSFIDYNINAPVINWARETVTPFIAYTYRIIPLLAETAIMRPWKYAKWAALGYGLNALGGYFSGGDEERERALMSEKEQGRIFGIPFMPHKNIKLPIPADTAKEFGFPDQKSYYIDVTRYVPGGDIFDLNSSGTMPYLPAPFQANFGLAGDIIIPMFGYDLFKKERLPGLGVSVTEDFKIGLSKTLDNLTPNIPFVPGSYTTERMIRARKGMPSPYTTEQTEFGALMRGLGFKINEADIKTLSAKKALEMNKKINSIKKVMTVDINKYKSGLLSYDDLIERTQDNTNTIKNIADSYSKKFNLRGQDIEPKTLLEGLIGLPEAIGKSVSEQTKQLFIK